MVGHPHVATLPAATCPCVCVCTRTGFPLHRGVCVCAKGQSCNLQSGAVRLHAAIVLAAQDNRGGAARRGMRVAAHTESCGAAWVQSRLGAGLVHPRSRVWGGCQGGGRRGGGAGHSTKATAKPSQERERASSARRAEQDLFNSISQHSLPEDDLLNISRNSCAKPVDCFLEIHSRKMASFQ